MKLLRPLLFLLLTLNGLLILPNLSSFSTAPGGEPERLASQLHPEKLSVEVPQAASEGEVSLASTPAVDAAVLGCVRWNGLSNAQADGIEARARALQLESSRELIGTPASWWVHMPGQPDRLTADRKAAELQRLGVNDYFIVNDPGPNQNAISLGLFKSDEAAKRALEELRRKGVQSARITERETTSVAVSLSGAPDKLGSLADALATELGSQRRSECAAAR